MIQFTATKILETIEGEKKLSVSFQAQKGEIIALYGDSGAGKTTTLRMLAGLTSSKEIEIAVENEIWDSSLKKFHLPTSKRSIGFVFQDFALFPNLTVKQNLAIALHKGEDQQIIDELLNMMEITQLSDKKPSCLSGGQQQRVALARAIVRKPKLLLLDEPLSALDNTLRLKLQDYILEIHKRFDLTTIIISHNIAEIFKLANRVLHLSNGKIIQQGTPIEIFNQSKSENQLEFIGEITHRYQKNKLYYVDILIENKIKFIEVTFEEYQHFQIGDRIILSSKITNFNLLKTNINPNS